MRAQKELREVTKDLDEMRGSSRTAPTSHRTLQNRKDELEDLIRKYSQQIEDLKEKKVLLLKLFQTRGPP